MQDRANVSADFLELMKQEIIEVIKKYIDVDESAIDVRMTNRQNEDGTSGAPALYANIPIVSIKDDVLREKNKTKQEEKEEKHEEEAKPEEEKKEKPEEASEEATDETEHKDEKTEVEAKEENEPEQKLETTETTSKH